MVARLAEILTEEISGLSRPCFARCYVESNSSVYICNMVATGFSLPGSESGMALLEEVGTDLTRERLEGKCVPERETPKFRRSDDAYQDEPKTLGMSDG